MKAKNLRKIADKLTDLASQLERELGDCNFTSASLRQKARSLKELAESAETCAFLRPQAE